MKVDITADYGLISVNPAALAPLLLALYGATSVTAPYTERGSLGWISFYNGETRLGSIPTYDFPEITQEGDRVFLTLPELRTIE
jgi:hypothetical protein